VIGGRAVPEMLGALFWARRRWPGAGGVGGELGDWGLGIGLLSRLTVWGGGWLGAGWGGKRAGDGGVICARVGLDRSLRWLVAG